MASLDLPPRYEAISRLGKGGGGEVWAVRDRHTGARHALKVLAEDASDGEMTALVREAVTLSGLEGLGVPRVLRFGRLPATGRPYLVRELVEGRSLQELMDGAETATVCLDALTSAADQVTLLHRAGLLHGDIKPANVIVEEGGRATLVDLGLASPLREAGTPASGLTPKYAAPELFQGKPLTVRAEVYALGVTLRDVLAERGASLDPPVLRELELAAERATALDPARRFPSADEFAAAVRRAARTADSGRLTVNVAELWPIVGIETTSARLQQAATALAPGGTLQVCGAAGSGRSVLLCRLGWSLGVAGEPLAWLDESLARDAAAVRAEIATAAGSAGPGGAVRTDVTILVDDCERLPSGSVLEIERARRHGARVVVVGDGPLVTGDATVFDVPPLGAHAAVELVRRAVPSLTEGLARRAVAACHGRPGELRQLVRRVAGRAIASEADLEELLSSLGSTSIPPEDPLARAYHALDRGRYREAREALESAGSAEELSLAVAWARLELGLGEPRSALAKLTAVEALAKARAGTPEGHAWSVYSGRSRIGLGEYAAALTLLDPIAREATPLGVEALTYRGLALSYLGEDGAARAALAEATERAASVGAPRIEALAEACLGSVLQRGDDMTGARAAYERAIALAQIASDAGVLATTRLNLAGLLKMSGDVAGAIVHSEAAVDMGKRSGRRATVRQALLNLANLDLYIGRVARARDSIETLATQKVELPKAAAAQLLGLEAELLARSGEVARAGRSYAACAEAYDELGLGADAAEARLEGVLVAARRGQQDTAALRAIVNGARSSLGTSRAHRALLSLASASVHVADGDDETARTELEKALAAAREADQKDWVWRTLEAQSDLLERGGQAVAARRAREEALAVLEEIAARLPRDLREVFWNDARRRKLRATVTHAFASAATELPDELAGPRFDASVSATSSIATLGSTPLERGLARILEVNTELLGEVNLERLTARVTDHMVDMLRAESGVVLLRGPDGGLVAHASRARGGEGKSAEFSRSVAEDVVRTGEPVVSVNAKGDSRLRGLASVHQLALESVACVPIRSRGGDAIGALYVETRARPGVRFQRELPLLRAFADQVAMAIETASLIRENSDRAEALASANAELEKARAELEEVLGERTADLRRARQKLRETRDTLYGHFGYQGLVGTSAAMRRVYSLIERVKGTDVPVLITGESGTGKEVAARALHRASPRAARPFFGLNCAAVPEHLLESELFGHVRGAFTGADRERKGLFREAEGGTVLLDEIGEMPARMQTGLLRVLQEKTVRPVGGAEERPVDVRLIFATHRNLEALVREGHFREDLFYRIHVIEVRMPALRERTEDIAPLVDHFLGLFAARYKRDKRGVSREALRRLAAFDWPGNVRQLEHVLLNAWVLSEEPLLDAADLDLPDGRTFTREPEPGTEPATPAEPGGPRRQKSGKDSHSSRHRREERERILQALESCNWNRVAAAKLSGIPRRTFYRRLREYGIQ